MANHEKFDAAVDLATYLLLKCEEQRTHQAPKEEFLVVLDFDVTTTHGFTFLVCQTKNYELQSIIVPTCIQEALSRYNDLIIITEPDAVQIIALRYYQLIVALYNVELKRL